jgi:hypothetical protein
VFRYVQGVKHRRTIVHAPLGLVHVFLHPVGFVAHVACSGAAGMQNVVAPYFMLMCTRCLSHEKHTRTHYTELLFLHTLQSTGHIVNSNAFRAPNMDKLFFMLR